MKNIAVSLLALIVFAGCRKSENFPADHSLYGKWELRSSSGGIAGMTYNYPAGNGNIMIFKIDGTVSSTTVNSSSTTTHSGKYKIVSKLVNGQRQLYLYLQTDNSTETQCDLSLKNDTFSIYPSGWADAFGTLWVKQQ